MSASAVAVTGIVLAGGQGSRMGGVDKGLQPFRGKPMVAHAIERFAPQVEELLINANRNPGDYERFGYRVIADEVAGFAGPLAGFERGLFHASKDLVATVPCDSPFLPLDLVARLRTALEATGADLAVAKTGTQAHPVFCLMRRGLHRSLMGFLARGERKIDRWYGALKVAEVSFDDEADAFLNINTRDDLASLEPRAKGGGAS
jgi:molybdopterin-guanine dinucleotide biosynthesis protein A